MGQTTSTKKAIRSGIADHDVLIPQNDTAQFLGEFQMNPDVWYSIFAYLRPLDLLNLARMCKCFRGILMAKSSRFVWEIARRRVEGLPECPGDLSEPAYTDLMFCARCHACGSYTQDVFWIIRRRYCSDCQVHHFCRRPFYHIMVNKSVLAAEDIETGNGRSTRFDKNQMDSLVREYKRTYHKKKFLKDRKIRYEAIYKHARECASWQQTNACRRERHKSILEHLKQLGYGPEISYFGEGTFQEPDNLAPRTLTDEEWAQMLPEWLETMKNYRRLRVYELPRLLEYEYDVYVRSPNTPNFGILPHVDELARFPPFQDVIKASKRAQLGEKPFASAFVQLPKLVTGWKKQLATELAQLIRIPTHLALPGASPHQATALTGRGRLLLACALFKSGDHIAFRYPSIFSVATYFGPDEDVVNPNTSIRQQFRIQFLEEAPYVVRACGLDPNVATPGDMDRRNSYLKCLACCRILSWKNAMFHSRSCHDARWQLVSDKYTKAIETAENSVRNKSQPVLWRCLLCHRRVGDAMRPMELEQHLQKNHGLAKDNIKKEVHYTSQAYSIGSTPSVVMVKDGERVRFKGR